jgi:hypothetical protein
MLLNYINRLENFESYQRPFAACLEIGSDGGAIRVTMICWRPSDDANLSRRPPCWTLDMVCARPFTWHTEAVNE